MTTTINDWTDVLFYFVPALLVIMGMFVVIRRFTDVQLSMLRKMTDRDMQLKMLEEKAAKQRDAMPLKLQAYERLILFLERISPDSLVVRIHTGAMNAPILHAGLLAGIRAEFEHNLSQQLYVSDNAWENVCRAKDAMASMVNDAYRRVGHSATGVQLSAAIFESALTNEPLVTQEVIGVLKLEARKLFS
ncbi:MAG: hypothetical protein RL021_204 [Bacteroidota bacterium]|jgi:hypothetical protein